MPRKLPWLAETPERKDASKQPARSSSSSAPKRKRASSPFDLVDSDLNARNATPKRREKKRPDRSPSTSPPPAPPDVEYMQEGYNADDVYMMVEDEFLSTAKLYTQHIHHAEYVRLKKLARSRGADVLQSISRPVDGRTEQSKGLKMKLESQTKARKIKNGISGSDDEDESSEDEYMHDPQLAGLMTREKSTGKNLSGIMKTKTNTRAAAGFDQSPRNIERFRDAFSNHDEGIPEVTSKSLGPKPKHTSTKLTNDGDDLEVASIRSKKSTPPRSKNVQSVQARDKWVENDCVFQKSAQRPKDETSELSYRRGKLTEMTESKLDTPLEGDNSLSFAQTRTSPSAARNGRSTEVSEFLAKRRADKDRREREEKRKSKRVDDVPTFLI